MNIAELLRSRRTKDRRRRAVARPEIDVPCDVGLVGGEVDDVETAPAFEPVQSADAMNKPVAVAVRHHDRSNRTSRLDWRLAGRGSGRWRVS